MLKIKKVLISSILFIALILFLGCSKEIKKIPITTSSLEARELYLKGLSLSDRLRSQEATTYFEDAIKLDSNFAIAYIGLATTQQNQNVFFESLQKATKLKENVSKGEQLWIEAIEAQSQNQLDKVRSLLRQLIDLYPDDERIHSFLATTYFQTQSYQESIVHYLNALSINDKYSSVYNQLGYVYRFLKNYNESEKMFKKYIELIPNDPNPYDSYGELLMQIGKFDESIQNYEKAIRIDPNFTFSYLGIASNLNFKNEHINARNRLQKFILRANSDTHKRIAYEGIIVSYIDEGNIKAAIKTTNVMRQLAIEANDTIRIANEYTPLGFLFLEIGELTKAEKLFIQSMKFIENSSFPEQIKTNNKQRILASIAMIKIKQKKFIKAQKLADEFSKYSNNQNNPNLIRLANQLFGMISLAEKKYELAIEFLRKSNQNNPYNIYRMALAYENLGDTEIAQSYFTKAAKAYIVSNRNYAFIRKKALAKISK